MGKSSKLMYVLSITALALVIVITLIFVGIKIFGKNALEKGEVLEPITSRYISQYGNPEENLTTSNLLDKEGVAVENGVNEAKQGVLQKDTSRQVVKFSSDLTQVQKTQIESQYNVSFTDDVPKNGVYVINVSEDSNVESLKTSELIASLETDEIIQLLSQQIDWGVQRIGANKVWDHTAGSGVIVAVIDTGVQLDHEDLVGNISTGFDFVNNRESAHDDNGHGTHVAGIIAAYNNNTGSVGGAPMSKIMPVKVLNAQGYGYLSDVAKGIYYAADNNARVINLSLGTTTDSSVLRDAVNYAVQKGVLVVGAAGNSAGSSCIYPAAYTTVVCVGATDQDNKLASFSNKGSELTAPGVSNYSTYVGNRYAYLSGTSMATPHVAASAALVFGYCSTCTSTDVRGILRENAVDLGDVGYDSLFGYGLVDAFTAVSSLIENEPEPEPEPEPEVVTPVPEEKPQAPVVEEPKPERVRPVPGKKPAKVRQSLVITEPELDSSRRLVVETATDLTVKFRLNPEAEESSIREIAVFLDNDKMHFVNFQSGEYVFKVEELTNNQYFVRVVAYFNDGRQDQQIFIIDLTKLKGNEKNNRANPRAPINRRVLGISTVFKY